MDNKIKLLVVTSLVAVMTTGCSRFNRTSNTSADGGYANVSGEGSSSQVSNGSQVGGGGRRGLFSQQRATTCAPCAANNTQATAPRVYKPAAPKPYRAPAATKPYRPAGQHSQQWYVDRWKRQQQQGQARPQQQNTNYDAGSNATYYDYSSAGKTKNNTANNGARTNTNVSTSNKSIYTGSYQQKTYKPYSPTTYSGGSSASTNTNTTYVSNSNSGAKSGGSTYIVKKGDTVFEIMRQTGVYWKDIIKLNNLQAPAYNINPGQAIRLK
ncbi:MAG: LysM peptidoglycan-binding domain-containing protein [Cocleimonas sp.]